MGSGGLNLPGVEKAMAEMEGGTAEDMKEKFARLGRRVSIPLESELKCRSLVDRQHRLRLPRCRMRHYITLYVHFEKMCGTYEQFQGLLATKGKTPAASGRESPRPTPAPDPGENE